MNCTWCDEPILPDDSVVRIDSMSRGYHRECLIRAIAGSAAHQLMECNCYGGHRADPAGLSMRDAARLARDTFDSLHGAEREE